MNIDTNYQSYIISRKIIMSKLLFLTLLPMSCYSLLFINMSKCIFAGAQFRKKLSKKYNFLKILWPSEVEPDMLFLSPNCIRIVQNLRELRFDA